MNQHFLMIKLGADSAPRQLNAILNWFCRARVVRSPLLALELLRDRSTD